MGSRDTETDSGLWLSPGVSPADPMTRLSDPYGGVASGCRRVPGDGPMPRDRDLQVLAGDVETDRRRRPPPDADRHTKLLGHPL